MSMKPSTSFSTDKLKVNSDDDDDDNQRNEDSIKTTKISIQHQPATPLQASPSQSQSSPPVVRYGGDEDGDDGGELVSAVYLSGNLSDDSLAGKSTPASSPAPPTRASSLGAEAARVIAKHSTKKTTPTALAKPEPKHQSESALTDDSIDDLQNPSATVGSTSPRLQVLAAESFSDLECEPELSLSSSSTPRRTELHDDAAISVENLFEGAELERQLDEELRRRRLAALLGGTDSNSNNNLTRSARSSERQRPTSTYRLYHQGGGDSSNMQQEQHFNKRDSSADSNARRRHFDAEAFPLRKSASALVESRQPLQFLERPTSATPFAATSPQLQHIQKQNCHLLASLCGVGGGVGGVSSASLDDGRRASRNRAKQRRKRQKQQRRSQTLDSLLKQTSAHFSLYALKYPKDQLEYALDAFKRWYRSQLSYNTLRERMEFDKPRFAKWYEARGRPLALLGLDHFDRIVVWIRDERDAIQQKTFTKWINKYLNKRHERIEDLFKDLRSGQHLISLLELLSGQTLPRERGKMRVHMLQNIQIALNFIRLRKVRLVNIRPEEIVDGNQKLTLGLIWTIILHFQLETDNFKEILLKWAQRTTEGYPGCVVSDLTSSWRDGLAFNAIIHRNRPDLLDYRICRKKTSRENLEQAFTIGERDLGATRLLDPEDVDLPYPDEKSMITYLAQFYELFPDPTDRNPLLDEEKIRRIDEYRELSSRLMRWIKDSTLRLEEHKLSGNVHELKTLKQENDVFRSEEIPPKEHDKQRLASIAREIYKMAQDVNIQIDNDLRTENIEHHWQRLLNALQARTAMLGDDIQRQERLKTIFDKLFREVKACNDKMNSIERDINDEEAKISAPKELSVQFSPEKVLKLGEGLEDVGVRIRNIKKLADDFINEADRTDSDTIVVRDKVTDLVERYRRLQSRLGKMHELLEQLKAKLDAMSDAMNKFNLNLDKLRKESKDIEKRFIAMAPVAKDMESLVLQLGEMKDFGARLGKIKPDLNAQADYGEELIRKDLASSPQALRDRVKSARAFLASLEDRGQKRFEDIENVLKKLESQRDAEAKFTLKLDKLRKNVGDLDRKFDLMSPVANDLASLQRQLADMEDFDQKLLNSRVHLNDVANNGEDLIVDKMIVNPRALRSNIDDCQTQLDGIEKRAANRLREIESALNRLEKIKAETDKLNLRLDGVRKELDELEHRLDSMAQVGSDHEKLHVQVGDMQQFIKSLEKVKSDLNDLTDVGEDLIRNGLAIEPRAIREEMKDCQSQLARLEDRAQKRLGDIQYALRNRESQDKAEAEFDKALQDVSDWLENAKNVLMSEENVHGDLDTINALIEQHNAFQDELVTRQPALVELRRMESELINNLSPANAKAAKERAMSVTNKWKDLERLSRDKSEKLRDAHLLAENFHSSIHSMLEWLADAEMKLRFAGAMVDDEALCRQEISEHEKLLRKLASQAENKDQLSNLARGILSKSHPDAEPVLKHWINILQSRWDEIEAWAKQRGDRLSDHMRSLQDILSLVEEIINYLSKHEARLLAEEAETLADNSEQLEKMMAEHQMFIEDLRKRETQVDKVVKIFSTKSNSSTSRTILHSMTTKNRPDSRASSGRFSAGSRSTTPTSRTSFATYRDEYPEVKQARAKIMLDKWRSVWQLSLDKMQRLKDRLEYLEEVERLSNFDFDEWRRRFLNWMNGKKARVMDFYRTIDKDNDGRIPVNDFVEGVMRSKFNTSRLEMDRVAEIFDKNRDGTIDHKEYLDTLRPDKPVTDDEVIQDEVQRQVSKCTCMQRYKVYHVGEGKYRFGESQKLRLVRILRSMVMVRVGGGWEALDEFLQKNDPCRARGRTNVELREQFILPEGASQAMATFRSKMSNIPTPIGSYHAPLGPITKVREKTDRSMPMSSASGAGSSSTGAGGSRFGSPIN